MAIRTMWLFSPMVRLLASAFTELNFLHRSTTLYEQQGRGALLTVSRYEDAPAIVRKIGMSQASEIATNHRKRLSRSPTIRQASAEER